MFRKTVSTRRVMLSGAVCAGLAACAVPSGRYDRLPSRRWLGRAEVLAELDGERAFAEGPAVAPDGSVFFTNMRQNRILRFAPETGSLTVYRENSNGANGMKFDARGRLVVCEGVLGRITRTDLASGMCEVLADKFAGLPIEDVNDLAIDAKGRIYFTSRPRNLDSAKANVSAVYRLDPDGKLDRLLARPSVEMPNGLAIAPGQSTFYLIDSNKDAGGRRVLEAFDLSPAGDLSRRRLLYDFSPGRGGDGMCVDRDGNLYVAAGLHTARTTETLAIRPGIHVFSPSGRLLAYGETPDDVATNCAFGHGDRCRTLFVTCGRRLLAMASAVPGP